MTQPQTWPDVRAVWTSDKGTMARDTALFRWPKIVQGIIDDVRQRLDEPGLDCKVDNEGPGIQIALLQLRNDIQQDQPLR